LLIVRRFERSIDRVSRAGLLICALDRANFSSKDILPFCCLKPIKPGRRLGTPGSPLRENLARSSAQINLVLSDYRMPSMKGVEFLVRLMEFQPTVPPVIISGNADRDAIIAAVNDAQLVRFIEKPWNDKQLRESVLSILANVGKRGMTGRDRK
jgi:CheY-like chemotaxis protein